jgi:hypothetical protein
MSRTRSRGGARRYYRDRSYGHDRALEHIAAAKRLSAELGGMDKGVKAYFLALPPMELSAILDDYERLTRRDAREYAEKTMPDWRSGRVQMSGLVAERLFNLLPPRMPLNVKYRLVEGLWHHVGPSSRHRIRVGIDADVEQVVELARSKITEFVVNYKIPADLERRFDWLSAGDVSVKQLLLGHFLEMEKTTVVEAVRQQVPVMLEHLRSAGRHTSRLSQNVRVGKHELELLMDKTATGARIEDPSTPLRSARTSQSTIVVWAVIIFVVVVLIVISRSHR